MQAEHGVIVLVTLTFALEVLQVKASLAGNRLSNLKGMGGH
jgi:hypothetical protein